MSNVLIDRNAMVSIASAIRTKLNTTDTYKPSEMPKAIGDIKTDFVTESIEITQNGTYTPSEGTDGFDEVVVNVEGGGSAQPVTYIDINDDYTASITMDDGTVKAMEPTFDDNNRIIFVTVDGVKYDVTYDEEGTLIKVGDTDISGIDLLDMFASGDLTPIKDLTFYDDYSTKAAVDDNPDNDRVVETTLDSDGKITQMVVDGRKMSCEYDSNGVLVKVGDIPVSGIENVPMGPERLYLYNEGDECVDVTGGWEAKPYASYPYSEYIYGSKNVNMFKEINDVLTVQDSNKFSYGSIFTKNKIDLSKYSKIVCEVYGFINTTSNDNSLLELVCTSDVIDAYRAPVYLVCLNENSNELCISTSIKSKAISVDSDFYVGFYMQKSTTSSNTELKAIIKSIYLEK